MVRILPHDRPVGIRLCLCICVYVDECAESSVCVHVYFIKVECVHVVVVVVFVRAFPLGPDQVLLRGAMLKNTKWIFGKTVDTALIFSESSAPAYGTIR